MKIDKTTYKDKEENQIGLTANHPSRPDKVLFFADPHFLFFNFMAAAQNTLLFFSIASKPTRKKMKECFPQRFICVINNSITLTV